MLQIVKYRTTPYRPQTNGQAERQNRSFVQAIRCFVNKKQDNWDEHLPQIAAALRSSVNRLTGFTPNMLMFGREIVLPAELIYHGGKNNEPNENYLAELRDDIQFAHDTARDKLKTTSEYAKKYYDRQAHVKRFSVGDAVYVLRKRQDKGLCQKLCPKFEGPAIITEVKSPYIYKILVDNRTNKIVNHDSLKICQDKMLPKWINRVKENLKTHGLQTYCICEQPYGGEFMAQCNSCNQWFHPHCMGVTKKYLQTCDEFICIECLHTP